MMIALIVFLAAASAYLLGSLNFAVIFSQHFLKEDVRNLGSGNAGATNMLRNGGVLAGGLTFLCDVLKGFAACLVGKFAFGYLAGSYPDNVWLLPIVGAYFCGVMCICGHVFPVFFGFKGGKGVATCVGIYAVCCPVAIIAGLTVFTLCVIFTRYVSLGSVLGAVTVMVLSVVFYNGGGNPAICYVMTILIGATVIVMHRANIRRLINRTESKFSIKKKEPVDKS